MIKIIDNILKFAKVSEEATDRALNEMCIDIERLSKQQVPHDKGQLKASGKIVRLGKMKYKVEYRKEYALFQHEGGDKKRKVKHYSKSGKKKHFLLDPANSVKKNALTYLKAEISKIKL